MNTVQTLAVDFNKTLMDLIRKVTKGDESREVKWMRKVVGVGIGQAPMAPLEKYSAYLWEFREPINAMYNAEDDSFDWFIARNQKKKITEKFTDKTSEDQRMILTLIDKAFDVFDSYPEEEKESVWESVAELVKITAHYRQTL